MSDEKKYDPYEDKNLHTSQPANIQPIESRKGFNDVINHYDSVNGFQSPKRMEQLPQRMRFIYRWVIIIGITLGLGMMLVELIKDLIRTIK